VGLREAEAISRETGFSLGNEVKDGKLYVSPPWTFRILWPESQ
jgi:hypothetical protein